MSKWLQHMAANLAHVLSSIARDAHSTCTWYAVFVFSFFE
jgi:hypothetical protein